MTAVAAGQHYGIGRGGRGGAICGKDTQHRQNMLIAIKCRLLLSEVTGPDTKLRTARQLRVTAMNPIHTLGLDVQALKRWPVMLLRWSFKLGLVSYSYITSK